MIIQNVQHFSKTKKQIQYPRLVTGSDFGVLKQLIARIDRSKIDDNLFLGYCKLHKKYYVDYIHTNGEIRCPICDKKWLIEHNL